MYCISVYYNSYILEESYNRKQIIMKVKLLSIDT